MFPGAQPTLRSTHPFVLAVLAVLGVPLWLLALAYGGLFVLWTMIALRQGATIPRRSISLFVLCSLLSALVFVLGWSEGPHAPGGALRLLGTRTRYRFDLTI